jgi:hypothetical protein
VKGRPALEVADIFREHGPAWREAQRGHLSLVQLKVMSAIVQCRSAALGGHVLRCDGCSTDQVSYNSCRNRHCPKCQSSAAKRWLQARQAVSVSIQFDGLMITIDDAEQPTLSVISDGVSASGGIAIKFSDVH